MRRLPSPIRGRIRCSLVQRTGPGLVDWIPFPAKHEEAVMMRFLVLALLLVPQGMLHAQSRNLDIYWIDVEGGAATLIVSPSGESMLIDTGWEVDGRDAKRIHAAAQQAGSKKIPIDRFYSRGDEIEPVNQKWLDSYRTAAAGKRTIVKPGDQIPIKGLQALVVASDGKLLAKPLAGGGPNPLCATTEQKAPAGPENQNMVGTLLTFGKFKLLALIDLDWEKEMELVCPVNKLGAVTLYQTSRHGSFDGAGAPAFLGAIRPQVAVMNKGPRKGLGQVDKNVKSTTPPGARTAPYEKNSYLRL